jgi:hypothetical protein
MKIKKFNENTDNITFDWEAFKKYVDSYDPKKDADNDWHIILEDMIYGLGIATDKEEFKYADGYKKFKEYLKDGISWNLKKDAEKYNL